jgi:transcription-repair coupling factor (superfamily II helicase)
LLAAAVRQARLLGKVEGTSIDLKFISLDSIQPMGLPVNVDLPLAIGIPENYVPDTSLRLRLYRRLADLTDKSALDALAAEFSDRFGPIPEMISNLFYQMQVKLLAEAAGLVSVGMETGQIVLRYPPSQEGKEVKHLPDMGPGIRGGKNAYWCQFGEDADWQVRLLEVLERLGK